MKDIQAIKLTPYLRDIIWGGKKLKEQWNKISDMDRIAESWELSAYNGMSSVACGGEFDGVTFRELFENHRGLFQTTKEYVKEFPILIKLIDASGDLSIQVHPDDEYAYRVEGEPGKTEMWYIADADEGAAIYFGFNRNVTKEEIAENIKNNTICDLLNRVPVKKGDAFFVKSGTPHAILRGITVIEIQESSNTTYRMYDYDRRGADGKPRELHVAKALEVLNTVKTEEPFNIVPLEAETSFILGDVKTELLANCEYFAVFTADIDGECEVKGRANRFVTFTVAEGSFGEFVKGDTVFVPIGAKVKANGKGRLIITTIN